LFGDEGTDATSRRKKMLEIGRVCMKIAGRDAGNLAVVVEKIDDNYVLIDGNVRRKKCNLKHLEPMKVTIEIKAKASTADVKNAMEKAGLKVVEKKVSAKNKQKSERPIRSRKVKKVEKPVKKKAVKKEEKK
jgi:large subunit ribosomal protein L14e